MAEEPKCVAEGSRIYTCTVCNKIRSEPIAAKGHSFSTTWKSDAYGHWHQCTGIRDYWSFGCYEKEDYAKHETRTVTLASDGGRKETCPTCGYNTTSAWTKDTLSELSAALNDYVETNANAKVKIVGELSDSDITTISDVLKQFSKNYGSSKQIDMDLSGTIGLKITEQMFYKCTSLASLMLPNDLTTIEKSAFGGCSSLTNVTLPNGLTTIGYQAFYDCVSLKSVTLPNSLKTIGDQAFYECIRLESVTLPNSLSNFGEQVFRDCKSLANVTIPDGLTIIGNCAFCGCKSLASITIPKSVTKIGYSAFWGCEKLEKVEGMEGLTVIEDTVFYECKSLKTIRIPSNVTEIGVQAFALSGLEEITLCDRLRIIGRSAFESCENLLQIEIPTYVYFIGNGAFSRCLSITSIKFKGVWSWKCQKWNDPTVSFDINVSDDKKNVEILTKDIRYIDIPYDLVKD